MQLPGKTCIVTGANTGLGFEMARRLVAEGASTTMLCRSREKGEAAVARIREEYPGGEVELAVCDLASLTACRDFIDGFKRRHDRLDILYNNAAVMKRVTQSMLEGSPMG